MAVFFLMIGLEIERELYVGELKSIKNAATPIAAAVGGMLFPALIYLWINWKSGMRDGVGIPMATDIAFAIGMLALLGKQVPVTLKIFLTALAIIDDLGAILFIAFFYSKEIHLEYLGIAGGILLVLSVLGRMKVYHLAFYLIPGIVVWYCFLKSGIHATIAGVLLAFAIPFGKDDASSPSYRLQHFLHKPVAFIILPIFALANTALVFEDGWLNDLASSNSMGIIAGLLAGKPVGILLFTFMVVKFGWGGLPEGVQWKQIVGTAFLAGIGFTMSIFISNLAFDYGENVQTSKMAILTGSLFACIAGLGILYFTTRRQKTGSG